MNARKRSGALRAQAVAILCQPKRGHFVSIFSLKRACHCLPGGSIEAGESVRQAAERELEEETGLLASAEPIVLGVRVAYRLPCAAVWIDAHGTLRGSHEGLVEVVPEKVILQGPYGAWAEWAIGLADKRGLLR